MKTKLLLGILAFFSITTLTFGAETIYTWGYGDILANILESVSTLMQTGDYKQLFKIFLVIGLVLVLLSYFGNKTQDPFALIKFYVITIGIWYLLLEPMRTDVYIDDKQNPSNNRIVQQVPYALAKALSWFSKVEKFTADKMELVFSVPTSLRYSSSGLLSGFNVMSNANSHKIIDPYLYLSTSRYIEDCVFPEILDGSKDTYTLSKSNDLWIDLQTTNGFRTTKYYSSLNPDGIIKTCRDAYNIITSNLNNYTSITGEGFKVLKGVVGAVSESQLNTLLGTASEHYLNWSVTGQAYLKQAIAMNMFSEAFQNFAKVNGISGDGLALGLGKAEETARYNMVLSGALGAKYIPIIKGILTVLIVALIPVLTLLLVTPMFKKVLIGFFMILGWLSLWHIGDVLLNAIIDIKASSFLSTIADGNYNLLIKGAIDSKVLDYINTVSSFYWAIPTIAFLIVSGFSVYSMAQMSGQVSGKMQGATGGTAGELATGSVNTSSSISTGSRWSFNSFSQIGNTMQLAYSGSSVFGTDATVNQRFSGAGEKKLEGIDLNSIRQVNNALEKIAKGTSLDLPVNSSIVGKMTQQGNTVSFDNSQWGKYTVSGTFNTQTGSGHLKLTDGSTGRVYDLNFANWNLSQAQLNSGGSSITVKNAQGKMFFEDKPIDGVGVSGVITKDGDVVSSVSMPDKVGFSEGFKQSISDKYENTKSIADSKNLLETYKEGNAEIKQSLIDSAFKVGSETGTGSKDGKKYVQDKAGKALETTIENLRAGNRNAIESGKKLDKEDSNKVRTAVSIGINRIPVIGSLLGIGGDIEKMWISKDSIFVRTSDGSYYEYGLTRDAKNEFTKNFGESLYTEKYDSASYKEGKDVSISNKEQSSKTREKFFQDIQQLANQELDSLSKTRQILNEKGVNISNDLTRFAVDYLHDNKGMTMEDALMYLNKNPSALRELAKDGRFLNYMNEKLSSDVKEISQEAGKLQEDSIKMEFSKGIMAAGSIDEIGYWRDQVEQAYEKGKIPDRDYAELNNLLGKREKMLISPDVNLREVKYKNYNEKDAREKAKEENIKHSDGEKVFDNKFANETKGMIKGIQSKSGIAPLIAEIENRFTSRYGKYDSYDMGIRETLKMLNSDIRDFAKKEGFTFTEEDYKSGRAIDKMVNVYEDRLSNINEEIGILKSYKDTYAYKNAPSEYKKYVDDSIKRLSAEKREIAGHLTKALILQNARNEVMEDLQLNQLYQQLKTGREKTTFGEEVKLDVPYTNVPVLDNILNTPEKQIKHPGYYYEGGVSNMRIPNRGSNYDDTPNYIGGPIGLSNDKLANILVDENAKNLQSLVRENLANNKEVREIRDKYINLFNNHSPIAQKVHDYLYKGERY